MKALNKKKFPEEKAAKMHVSKKFGVPVSQVQLIKEHRTRWMFRIVAAAEAQATAKEIKPWTEFVADFRANNPDMAYREAVKAASDLYNSLKKAAEDQEQKAA